mgnify:CR=1 FL=1
MNSKCESENVAGWETERAGCRGAAKPCRCGMPAECTGMDTTRLADTPCGADRGHPTPAKYRKERVLRGDVRGAQATMIWANE